MCENRMVAIKGAGPSTVIKGCWKGCPNCNPLERENRHREGGPVQKYSVQSGTETCPVKSAWWEKNIRLRRSTGGGGEKKTKKGTTASGPFVI